MYGLSRFSVASLPLALAAPRFRVCAFDTLRLILSPFLSLAA